jgi:hypothetical protein
VLGITLGTNQKLGLLDRTVTTLQYWQQRFFGLLEFNLNDDDSRFWLLSWSGQAGSFSSKESILSP